MIRVFLISDPASSHTVKWVRSLSTAGIEVCIFGLNAYPKELYASFQNIRIITINLNSELINSENGNYRKLRYLSCLPKLRKAIEQFKPDIVHAHYATSYGLLGALSGFHPFLLSVWGSDIFQFPKKSPFHKLMLKFNLMRADRICSTSHVMAREVKKFTDKPVKVISFGIDLAVFQPKAVKSFFLPTDIVVGTVKALEEIYGVEYLIRAFHQVKSAHPELPLKLLIVGGGSQETSLKNLANSLGLHNCARFTGRVAYDEVVQYQNMLSIFVAVSISESFGVAAIEASACEKPVIVSDVGGFPEVVEDGITGIIVPSKNVTATVDAIERLVLDKELRIRMGRAGRKRVEHLYDWDANVAQMINTYRELI